MHESKAITVKLQSAVEIRYGKSQDIDFVASLLFL